MNELLNDIFELSERLPKLCQDLERLTELQAQAIEQLVFLDDLTTAALAKAADRRR